MTDLSFDRPDLAKAAEAVSPQELDDLPFGTIRLAPDGSVVLFSEAEARLSGYGKRPRMGLDFFSHIAPCMDTPAFRGRAERARAAGTLDVEFTHIGDFDDRDKELTVRIQSASDGGMWIFMRRES